MSDAIGRWLDGLYLLCMWIAGLGIVAMSLVIPWGVFARYVLGSGSQWPEPVAIMLMTVFTFFGAAVTYRAAGHIAVETLVLAVPPRWRGAMAVMVSTKSGLPIMRTFGPFRSAGERTGFLV